MPRARRYTRAVYRPKKRWASHLFHFGATTQSDYLNVKLAENSESTQVPTATIIKTGNFKVNIGLTLNRSQSLRAGYNVTVAIMYIPEGVQVNSGSAIEEMMMKHPEWVLACKYKTFQPIDEEETMTTNLEVSSRLKRNLNSGDTVNILVRTSANFVSSIGLAGIVRFWSKAN